MAPRPTVGKCLKILHRRKRFAAWATVIRSAPVERTDQNVAETKKTFESELATAKQYLGWLRDNATIFNNSLPPIAREAVAARRRRLAAVQQGKDSLGIPIRSSGAVPTPSRSPI